VCRALFEALPRLGGHLGLILCGVVLVYFLWTPLWLPVAGSMLSTVDLPTGRKEVLVAADNSLRVLVYGADALEKGYRC